MRRMLALIACAIFSSTIAAAGTSGVSGNVLAEKGYAGNAGLSVSAGLGIGADLFTSHGYSFGNGLWIGGGTGLSFPSPYDLFLPLYSEIKYSFLADRRVSPFLSARVGGMTNFDECRMILCPAFGVDISRFSVFATSNLGLVSMRTFGVGLCWYFK